MHIKTFSAEDWDFGIDPMAMIKFSERGLVGFDRDMLIKRASEVFADLVRKTKFASDEIPVHLIAVGATEAYGPNRNGDGFKEATCRSQYMTFVKDAMVYENHKNKDPAKSYGSVKAAVYNEAMRRIELLLAVNGTKEAADRNHNLFSEKMVEMLHDGKMVPWSMACKVAYDVCSGCGNKAKTRDDYCTEDMCKYGGCKKNLTKVAADGHILHVDNPGAMYFDISRVIRPADRIAYGGVADYLLK